MDVDFICSGSILHFAGIVRFYNLYTAEADNNRNESANEDDDDFHADFHRLDQYKLSGRIGVVLGYDEYHADFAAVVDVPW